MFEVNLSKRKTQDTKILYSDEIEGQDTFELLIYEIFWKEGQLDTVLAWCREHCKGRFGFSYDNRWFFDHEPDYVHFVMVWAS